MCRKFPEILTQSHGYEFSNILKLALVLLQILTFQLMFSLSEKKTKMRMEKLLCCLNLQSTFFAWDRLHLFFYIEIAVFEQGVIVITGTETFAKEPKLEKLLRRLKSTPVLNNKKKFTGFSPLSVMANLLCFGCFAAG